MRHSPSGKRHINRLGKFARCDAITGKHLATRNYVELRALHLLLDIGICNTRDFRYLFLYLFAGGEQPVEVGTEQFYCYLGLGSREHGVNAMGDRLPDLDIDARQFHKPGA